MNVIEFAIGLASQKQVVNLKLV